MVKEYLPVRLSAITLASVPLSKILTSSECLFMNLHTSFMKSLTSPSVVKSVKNVAFQKHLLKSTLVAFLLICTSVVCLSSAIFIISAPFKIHNHNNCPALRFHLHQNQVLLPVRQFLPIVLPHFVLLAYRIAIAYALYNLMWAC